MVQDRIGDVRVKTQLDVVLGRRGLAGKFFVNDFSVY
jgi:hypothetical protein